MGCNYLSVLADKAFNYIGNDPIFLKRTITRSQNFSQEKIRRFLKQQELSYIFGKWSPRFLFSHLILLTQY